MLNLPSHCRGRRKPWIRQSIRAVAYPDHADPTHSRTPVRSDAAVKNRSLRQALRARTSGKQSMRQLDGAAVLPTGAVCDHSRMARQQIGPASGHGAYSTNLDPIRALPASAGASSTPSDLHAGFVRRKTGSSDQWCKEIKVPATFDPPGMMRSTGHRQIGSTIQVVLLAGMLRGFTTCGTEED